MKKSDIKYTVNFMGIDRPSQALRAMIEGLKEADARPTFTIRMATFGTYAAEKDMCYGCAATATLMKLTGRERIVKDFWEEGNYRTPGITLQREDKRADSFENRIDNLRTGSPQSIFEFFGFYDEYERLTPIELPGLYTDNWKENLHFYEKALVIWEEAGL